MKICVCAPQTDAYSETFIREHIRRLPAEIVLYGLPPDTVYAGRKLAPKPIRSLIHRAGAPYLKSAGALAARFAARNIVSFLKRFEIDIVLAEYGPTAVAYLPACRAAGVPLAAHFHGYDLYESQTVETFRNEYRTLFAEAACMIVVSSAMQRRLEEMAGSADRVFVIPCGANVELFNAADPAANAPLFVSVGRFVDKKAPHLTLVAFQQVIQCCPESRLVMVGDGPLLPACRELARALRLEESVQFTGRVEPGCVAALLANARAFVQHSVTAPSGDSEGTPVAVMEAGASALPVVATRHAGIPDVVLDGGTGLLCDEFDVTGMAAHMIRLVQEPGLAARLGHAARERVTAHFSSERTVRQLRDALAWAVAKS